MVEVKGEIVYFVFFFEWFFEEVCCVYGDVISGYVLDKCLLILK